MVCYDEVVHTREALMATILYPSAVAPADHIVGPPQGQWTYDDTALLPDDEMRYEILAGVLYMAPPPLVVHQGSNNLFQTYLTNHVQLTGKGLVFGPPFEVRLSDTDVLQPDVTVILNEHRDRLTRRGITGAPDLVVEIASPSTATYDRRGKFTAYERAGVPEYWIVDPYARTVEVWVLTDGAYVSHGVFEGAATLPSVVIVGFPARVEQLFL